MVCFFGLLVGLGCLFGVVLAIFDADRVLCVDGELKVVSAGAVGVEGVICFGTGWIVFFFCFRLDFSCCD